MSKAHLDPEHETSVRAVSPTGDESQLPVGFLLSGKGRTLDNLLSYLADHPSIARVVAVVSSRADARGLEKARIAGIPCQVHPCRTPDESNAIFAFLAERGARIALLGGWLRRLRIPELWRNRVLNIHPALIPKFSGKGFYGDRVHRAVLAAGETETGCTVHFVDDQYDHGPILLAERVPVLPGDDVESLAGRVFEAECRAYPRALELIARGRVQWRNGLPEVSE